MRRPTPRHPKLPRHSWRHQTGAAGKIDLYGRGGDIQQDRVNAAIALIQPYRHIQQVPECGAAFMHQRRERLGIADHQLAQVLAGHADGIGDIGESHQIGNRFDQRSGWHRQGRSPWPRSLNLLRGQMTTPRGLTGRSHECVITAGLAQAFDQCLDVVAYPGDKVLFASQ